jgi:HlyD family secretion protein
MKKRGWIVLVIILLVGAGYLGYTAYRRLTEADPAAAKIVEETAVVERGTLRVTVDGSGSLAPQQDVAVAFATGGEVVEVLVAIGDRVKAGEVLARLDDTDARQAVTEAEMQVRQSEASLALAQIEAEAGLALANLAAAQTDYERTLVNAAHTGDQLTSARVKLEQAQTALTDAQEAYDSAYDPGREWELGDRRLGPRLEAERETAERNLQKAQDDLAVAQASYNLAVIGIDESAVQDAEIKVINAQIALDKEPVQLEQAQLSLDQAELKLASARRTLEATQLVAPVDGTVTALNVAVGHIAGSGQEAVTLSDLDTLLVDIGLDETDIAQVSLGQAVIVTLDAFDDVELAGTITAIAPVAETQSGVVLYPVTVTLDPTDLPVRAGMTADVEIVTRSAEDVLHIPLRAVRSVGGRAFVLRQLRPGEEAPTASEIRQGAGRDRGRPSALPQRAGTGTFADMTAEERQQMRSQMQGALAQLQVEGYTPVPVELGMMTATHVEVLSGLEEGDVVSVSSTTASSDDDARSGPMPGMGMLMGRP